MAEFAWVSFIRCHICLGGFHFCKKFGFNSYDLESYRVLIVFGGHSKFNRIILLDSA